MAQLYIQRFVELFLNLTGINAEEAKTDEEGWLFVPFEINTDEKYKYDRETIKALGWRDHLVNGGLAGWWVKPWQNIEAGQFVSLTLNDHGAESFSYLKNGKAGQRHVYFINDINTGGISGAPMLLGQFLFEFEECPEDALRMTPGGTNQIYYPRDKRIESYNPLTEEEIQDTKNRLAKLAEKYPAEVAKLAEERVKETKNKIGVIEKLSQTLEVQVC